MSIQTGAWIHPQVPRLNWGLARRLLQVFAFVAVWSGVLFGSAGRLDWFAGRVCVSVYLIAIAGAGAAALWMNPSVLAERGKWHKDTKPFDKVFMAFYLPLIFLQPAVAGLDAVRFGWSPLPERTLFIGVILYAIGAAAVGWAIAVNPHRESTVRIQTERNHRVITSGPYHWVRHPMYVGGILQTIAVPLILGSGAALLVSAAIIVLVIWRTVREDDTLLRELTGYSEYARRTRYRLLPGVW